MVAAARIPARLPPGGGRRWPAEGGERRTPLLFQVAAAASWPSVAAGVERWPLSMMARVVGGSGFVRRGRQPSGDTRAGFRIASSALNRWIAIHRPARKKRQATTRRRRPAARYPQAPSVISIIHSQFIPSVDGEASSRKLLVGTRRAQVGLDFRSGVPGNCNATQRRHCTALHCTALRPLSIRSIDSRGR